MTPLREHAHRLATLRYVAIDASTADRLRTSLVDSAGNRLTVECSTDDGNPCRSCLRLTAAGTELILAAHRPFATDGPYAEIGPIFIHARACTPHAPDAGFPADFRPRTLVFRAYDRNGRIACAELGAGTDAEAILERVFSAPEIASVHVRNPAWGCYDFRVERA